MMNVRVRPRHQTPSSFHPLLMVLLLAVPIVFIFLFSVLFVGNDLSKVPTDTHINKTSTSIAMTATTIISTADPPTILYEKIKEHSTKDVYRYAAFVEVEGTKTPLSIRQWAILFTHEQTQYTTGLANDLSSILKVGFVLLLLLTLSVCWDTHH